VPSRAALLLSAEGDSARGNGSRLLIGLGGISFLGLITPSASALSSASQVELGLVQWLTWCGLQMSSFAAVGALTLTMALPGLLILLSLFQIQLGLTQVFNAVARAYLRAGLFCLGFVPCLLLYATTGGQLELTFGSGILCYFAAGTLGLWTLALELKRLVDRRLLVGNVFVLGWFLLSALLGTYLFAKMQDSILQLEFIGDLL
jgi:hypothetical protein